LRLFSFSLKEKSEGMVEFSTTWYHYYLEGVSTKVFGKVFFSSQNNKDNE
jgi:hypothetical protein